MMGAAAATVDIEESPVDTGDRLSFTFFLALVVHALLILGITFKLPEPQTSSQTIEITLANYKSDKAPEKADFLAQQNQEGSGTEEKAQQLTTERVAEFADTQIRDINPVPQQRAVAPQDRVDQAVISTQSRSRFTTATKDNPEAPDEQQMRDGLLEDQPAVSVEIASLQAKLDRQRQEYAKRPRIRTLTSVSTRESHDAKYLHDWSTKIEQVGNKNYPQEALRRRITGSLRLSVVLNPDGTIYEIKVLQTSGQRILDDAALQIVRLASPFNVFPSEIRQHFDRLQIIRTWNFQIDGLSTSAE
jgi:protein TonB